MRRNIIVSRTFSFLLVLSVAAVAVNASGAEPQLANVLPNVSFEEQTDGKPAHWKTHTWGGKGEFTLASTGRTGSTPWRSPRTRRPACPRPAPDHRRWRVRKPSALNGDEAHTGTPPHELDVSTRSGAYHLNLIITIYIYSGCIRLRNGIVNEFNEILF